MKILIVDDSLTMRRIIGNVVIQLNLTKDNYREASNGLEAWNILKEEKIDIILTDWNMPVMNGLELVKKIRTSSEPFKKIPILMITTEGGKEEVITALKAGVNNYIVKPFNAIVLKEKIHPFLPKN